MVTLTLSAIDCPRTERIKIYIILQCFENLNPPPPPPHFSKPTNQQLATKAHGSVTVKYI